MSSTLKFIFDNSLKHGRQGKKDLKMKIKKFEYLEKKRAF